MMVAFFTALIVTQPAPTPLPVLTLEQAFKEADERNLDLKAAKARLEQVQQLSAKAWAGYLPSVSLGASYTRYDTGAALTMPTGYYLRDLPEAPPDNGPAFDPTQPVSETNPPGAASNTIMYPAQWMSIDMQKQNQYGAQAQVSQAVFVPALWAAIRTASLAGDVAELTVKNARREIMFGVAQLYYGIVGLKETVAVRERLLQNNTEHERDASVRFASGTLARIGLVRAKIDRAVAEQELSRARATLESMKLSLATLLGREADFDVTAPEQNLVLADVSSLEEAALSDRLDLQAARFSTKLAESTRTGAWLKYLPNVIAQAQYRVSNVTGFTGQSDSWAVMLMASWNIFDGGLREAELREAGAKVAEAQAAEQSLEIKTREEVRRATLDLEMAQANLVKANEQRNLARENTKLVDVSFANGMSTPVDVSDANTQLAMSELGVIGETLNAKLAALRLLKAAGAFDPQ